MENSVHNTFGNTERFWAFLKAVGVYFQANVKEREPAQQMERRHGSGARPVRSRQSAWAESAWAEGPGAWARAVLGSCGLVSTGLSFCSVNKILKHSIVTLGSVTHNSCFGLIFIKRF